MRGSLVAVAAVLLATPFLPSGLAAKTKFVPCADHRYVLRTGGDALVADSAPLPAAVAFEGRQIALGTHCAFRNGSVKATKNGTKLVGHWPACGALKAVSLKATIAPGCRTMSGTFRAKKVKPQGFTATFSDCGDGIFDAMDAESCDGANGCTTGERCNAMCQCESIPVTTPTTTTLASLVTSTTTTAPATTVTTSTATSSTVTSTSTTAATSSTASSSTTTTTGGGGTSTTSSTIPVCGDGHRNGTETCDDGVLNGTPGDPCPGNCVIAACTPVGASARQFRVSFTPPAGKSVTGITVNLDYPEGKVVIPGSGQDSDVTGAITNLPFGAFATPNDVDWALEETVAKGTSITVGRLFTVTFKDCQGATAPALTDFTCTVVDAADNSVPPQKLVGVTCAVTAGP